MNSTKKSGPWPFSSEQEELLKSVWGAGMLDRLKSRRESQDIAPSESLPTGEAPSAPAPVPVVESHSEIRPEDLIGQTAAKAALAKVIALARVAQERKGRGLPNPSVTLHAAFTGSPGTGKTTFARYYAQEVRRLGFLKTGPLIEVSITDCP